MGGWVGGWVGRWVWEKDVGELMLEGSCKKGNIERWVLELFIKT